MKKTGDKAYLLDTNIVIDLLKGNRNIADQINKSKVVYIPVPVLGELYLGAENSNRKQHHVDQIDAFLNIAVVMHTTDQTAVIYGQIKSYLKKNGIPIPENDIWIAAMTKEHDLPIITRDKHFKSVPDINIVEW